MSYPSIEIQLDDILKTFDTEVNESIEKIARKVAQDAAKKLRSESASKFGNGEYAKGWTYRKDKAAFGTGYVVYNKNKPQLTHLLEHGHEVKPAPKHPGKKSRVAGRPHIKGVEEEAKAKFEEQLINEIKNKG